MKKYFIYAFIFALIALGLLKYFSSYIFHSSEREKIQQLFDERQQLDETLWSEEVHAQKYEEVIIQLWDDLRAASDKFKVLNRFTFDQIILKERVPSLLHDGKIIRAQFKNINKTLNFQQWRKFLKDMQTSGYELVQSEWQHEQFHWKSPDGATSTFSAVMHIANKASNYRGIFNVAFDVQWSSQKDPQGHFIPHSIEVTNIEGLERQGGPVFESALTMGKWHLHSAYYDPLIVYDLDRDGLSEVLLPAANLLYRNEGGGRFIEEEIFPQRISKIVTAIVAEFTQDLYPDLIITREGAPPLLFRGVEGGQFDPLPQKIIIPGDLLQVPLSMSAGDIDQDGLLDLWIGQYKPPYDGGQMPTPYYDANDGFPSYLLLNVGNGRFQDITIRSGLGPKRFRRTYTSALVDLDEDRDLDLLTVNDFSGIDVYFNDGKGKFTEVTSSAIDERTSFGMGHTFGDFNLDGRLDFYVTGMSSTTVLRLQSMGLFREGFSKYNAMKEPMTFGNRMYMGQENLGVFKQPLFKDQIARTGWSWGTTSFDFDNDRDTDIYVGNGFVSFKTAKDRCTVFWRHDVYMGQSQENEVYDKFFDQVFLNEEKEGISWNGFEHNFLFRNDGGKSFLNIAFLMDVALEVDTRSVVSEDLDLDGRVDLLISDANGLVHVLNNKWSRANNWIGVILEGRKGVSPLGAKIIVQDELGKQVKQIVTGDSYLAQHSLNRHFGLGSVTKVDSIEVRWPNGEISFLKSPKIRQYHQIRPPGIP